MIRTNIQQNKTPFRLLLTQVCGLVWTKDLCVVCSDWVKHCLGIAEETMGKGLLKVLLWATLSWLVGSEDAAVDDDYYNDEFKMNVCQKGLAVVNFLEVLCDSPYTFYYGNGAHRNSRTCDYGDKVSISISLDVVQDLDEGETIYLKMGAYSPSNEELYLSDPEDLCASEDCYYEGTYNFTKKIQFAYIDGEDSQFVPYLEMAFSSETDGGYDLGGVNVNCNNNFIDWASGRTNTTLLHIKTQSFISNYGILLGTILVLGVFAMLLMRQASDRIEYEGAADPKTVELMQNRL